MSTTATLDTEASCMLRASLRGNAVFSAVSGIVLIAGAAPLGTLLGVGAPAVLLTVGVILVLYAGGLWWNARRPEVNRAEARIAVALDVAWVVLSAALLIFAPSLLTRGALAGRGRLRDRGAACAPSIGAVKRRVPGFAPRRAGCPPRRSARRWGWRRRGRPRTNTRSEIPPSPSRPRTQPPSFGLRALDR